jgi:hypothetical protein
VKEIGQPLRLGVWMVKPGKGLQFVEEWQASADWVVQKLPGDGEALLLQDAYDPGRFVSFGSSSNPGEAEKVMSQPEFQELWSGLLELCEEVRPHRMHLVGYAGGSSGEGEPPSE